MLAKVFLCYLQLKFQIYKLLGKIEGDNGSAQPDLLEISAKMLETSVQVANIRNREGYFPYPVDLTSHVCTPYFLKSSWYEADTYKAFHFGLPAAAILTTALQDMIRDPSRNGLPSNVNRACLIRNISVLVSHLEGLHTYEETHSVEQASYRHLQASKTISRRLDQILEGVFNGPASTIPPNFATVQEGLDSSSNEHCSNFPTNFAPISDEAVDLEGFDTFDFDTWATSAIFDLETTRHDWNMF